MFNDWRFDLTLGTAVGCGLAGGTFFAFSTFIMPALNRLPAAQGLAAMQSINITVLTPWFMLPFFGTAVACLILGFASLTRWHEPMGLVRLLGCGLYLVGSIGVTIACNVPRNDALAAVAADSPAGATLWSQFVPGWTLWNTVRAVASLAAAVALIIALVADGAGTPSHS